MSRQIEELKAELMAKELELAKALGERDELAVQVAYAKEAAENATGVLCGHSLKTGNTPLELMACKVMREQQARDARMKAEVLESLSKSSYSLYLNQLLRHIAFMADQYRSQAGEVSQ